MAGTERTSKLTGFEALGLLTGTHRGGDWSGPLPELTGLSVDSRQTEPGHLFAALPGSQAHGAAFVPAALAAGAAAILTDPAGLGVAEAAAGPLAVPVILHDQPRRALSIAASRWYGDQPEVMVAVTGTNGKTSVASFTRQILGGARRDRRQLRHRRRRGRGLGPAQPHHPRADHPAPPARRARRQGRHPRGDGGLLARPRSVPPRRRPSRRRRLHQHQPRPPRLPRGLRDLLPGQARPLRAGPPEARHRRCQSRRPPRPPRPPHREISRPAPADHRPRRGLRPAPDRPALRRRRPGAAVRLGRQDPQGPPRPDRRLPGRQRPRLRRPRHRLGRRPGSGHRHPPGAAHRPRPHGARRPPRRTAPWSSSTTPTLPTR